jgi:small-conductance mechanosensitive channel
MPMNERIVWPAQTAAWVVDNRDALLLGLLAALVLVAIMLTLRSVGRRIVASDPQLHSWKSVIGRVLAKTSILFMATAALDVVASYTEMPHRPAHIFDIAFVVAFALQGAVWARELVMGILGRQTVETPGETALDNARAVVRVLVSVALFAIAVVVILDNLGVNVTGLVAGLGIGGIAIGLAAQGIFSDLFAALSILFDKPFKRGDTISYGDSIGTVERIGLKTTRLKAVTGEQLVMANTKLLDHEVRNLSEGRARRVTLKFGVTYQTGVEKLERIPEIARAAVETRKGCSLVRCAMTGFGGSSLDFELLYDDRTIDYSVIAADRTAIMIALIKTFAEAGVDFAYPTQTTFTAAPDGSLVMPYPAAPGRS